MFDISEIGNKIKELRQKRGLTQKEFAEKIRVSAQAVSAWERGIAPPDLDNLVRIAELFTVLIDDLIRKKSDEFALGVDGGGTKTSFAVVRPDGHMVDFFTRDGSNPNDLGFDASIDIIHKGISAALLNYPSIRSVFCGIAGAATSDNAKRMTEYLSKRFPSVKISVKTDSANLFAMDHKADMAVICGTGSVVYVHANDRYERLGGWGYLFDDAGSGYDIGNDAVTTALSEEDKKEEETLITKLLKEKLGVKKIWDAVKRLYDGGRSFIASLSGVVFEAYKAGDFKAEAIIDRNAKKLSELLNLGVSLYNVKPYAIAGGGIFERHTEIMIHHMKKYTKVKLVIMEIPQIYGACRIAAEELGCTSCNFYENFKKSYGDIKNEHT